MKNNKQQTAVEWLVEKLEESGIPLMTDEFEMIQQAKQMEKEKQKYFFDCGRQYQLTGEGTFNQVHKETYGGNNGK
jgi:hypothetical protein